MNIQEALEKIKKLLALSQSNNPNEAAAAAAAASRIAQQHRISQAEIESAMNTNAEGIRIDKEPIYKFKKEVQWKASLLNALVSFYGCYMYRDTFDWGPVKNEKVVRKKDESGHTDWVKEYVYAWKEYGFCIAGRDSDIQIVRFMFSWISVEFTRLSVIDCKGKGKSYSNSWLMGAVDGLRQQLRELKETMKQEAQKNNQSSAMVLLDARGLEARQFTEAAIKLVTRKIAANNTSYDSGAFYKGREKGKNIHLGKHMGSASRALPPKS